MSIDIDDVKSLQRRALLRQPQGGMMSSIRKAVHRAACLLLLFAASALPAGAQTTLGTIRGTVFDPQQQVVPGATVVIADESTGVTREAQTDAQGLFEIPNLRPG